MNFLKKKEATKIFTHHLYPFKISLLHLICYLQNGSALKMFFEIVEKFQLKLKSSEDFFGFTPLQIALDNPIITNILTNFLICKQQLCSGTLTQNGLSRLLRNDFPQIGKLLDSTLVKVENAPNVAPRFESNFKTFTYKSKFIPHEMFSKLIPTEENKLNCTIDVYFIEIGNILDFESNLISLIARLDSSHPIFTSEVLEYVLNYKWEKYGFKEFYTESKYYALYFIIYVIYSQLFAVKTNDLKTGHCNIENNYTLFVFLLILFFFNFKNAFSESVQMKNFIKSKNFKNYRYSIWNWIDWLVITLTFTSTLLEFLHLICSSHTHGAVIIIHVINTFLVWIKMIGFMRGSDAMSSLIRMILEVVSGLKDFFIFLFIICFAFTFSGLKIIYLLLIKF